MARHPYQVLSPTAILGYGFPEDSFRNGMDKKPDLIAVDAGSTDPGPYYLGSGKSFTNRLAVKRDLSFMLRAAVEASIPLIIGTAGGSGARPHVEWTLEIIEELARENGISFRMAVIHADIPQADVLDALARGRLRPLPPAPQITPGEIRSSTRIVAQMGAEPVIRALSLGCRIIVCGRCYDPVPFAAPPLLEGFDPGPAYHMGKILECAAIAATPGSGRDCVMGLLYEDCFELESLNAQRRFTRISTAAHTLYEKSDPYSLPGPGGMLDLRNTRFVALENGRVRVSGSRFIPAPTYCVKLEGVKPVGFRTISIAGIRDPVLIGQIEPVLDSICTEVEQGFGGAGRLLFHRYGQNAVMGALEPEKNVKPHEVGLVIEAVAPDQEQANALCAYARSTLLHYGYPKRISTAGNLALLYSPSDISCGEVFEFNIYHLMETDDPSTPFPIEVREVGR